ncbi:FG-GAP-like repeat-containing protein [Streptomyces sp. CB02115]|uniref:FG-GAP-like repeat-containing protein n=2 Tax=Streptomyces TaxID=1883 RepID=UPI00093BFD44|nr:FG-GAP-like repeat-containing protein [Streptomyces sp. CB02115]OKJ52893.1 Ricin B lectin [Streptomyces sp. CB02115]
MPVPTQELKLEIVNAATGQPLGAKATPAADGTLVVRDHPKDGPRPELWQFTPVPGSQDDPAYVIRNTAGGKVLDTPPAAGQGVRQSDASGKKGQQWRLVPVAGEAGLYFIEGAADGAVLDLDEPGKDDTRIVLGEYDDLAESQRWRFVPAEPERTSDLVLDWAPLSHWNSRQSWRLTHHKSALRPAPDATPSFSNVLLVLEKFGSDQDAAGWKNDAVTPSPAGEPGHWAGVGARFLADTEGAGRADIVAIRSTKGAVTSSSRGDGTFDDERPLHQGVATPNSADLWSVVDLTGNGRPDVVALCTGGVRVSAQGEDGAFTPEGGELVLKAFGHGKQAGGWLVDKHPRFLADTTGDGRLDVLGCHDDGLWVSLQDEEGKFAPLADEPALPAFGHSEAAGGWLVGKHPRFLADTTGDGRLDVLGCHDDGLWVSLQDEEGAFAEPLYVLDEFGVDQGWNSTDEHPRFLVTTTRDGVPDVVGFGPYGVVVARGRGDGTFEPAQLVLNDFGQDQGWTGEKHPRLLADVTGDKLPDIIGFGNEGVWVSHNNGDGTFEQAQLVCRGFGYNEDAGGWRVDRHPRFLADITGDGRVDIVGFGGPGVHVARNLHRRFRTR